MKIRIVLLASILAAGAAAVITETATAQGMQGHMGAGMMQGGSDQQPTDHGMMEGDMGRGMMQGGRGGGMMCPMMRSDTMQGGMTGSAMMGSGMTHGGMGALFGSRVTPVMNLSVEDVRGYLDAQLQRLNNKRLKLGDVNSADATITADIITVDNSLVQRLQVDRHTGAITYEN